MRGRALHHAHPVLGAVCGCVGGLAQVQGFAQRMACSISQATSVACSCGWVDGSCGAGHSDGCFDARQVNVNVKGGCEVGSTLGFEEIVVLGYGWRMPTRIERNAKK